MMKWATLLLVVATGVLIWRVMLLVSQSVPEATPVDVDLVMEEGIPLPEVVEPEAPVPPTAEQPADVEVAPAVETVVEAVAVVQPEEPSADAAADSETALRNLFTTLPEVVRGETAVVEPLWDAAPDEHTEDDEPPPPIEEEYDFRRIRWGMSKAEVQATEWGVLTGETPQSLTYSTTTMDYPCLLTYSFTGGRLMGARISFTDESDTHLPPLTPVRARSGYSYWREQLRVRYGDPVERVERFSRDASAERMRAQKREEDIQQYNNSIAETRERIAREKVRLERRYSGWQNSRTYVQRGLAPYERHLQDLQQWKTEAVEQMAESQQAVEALKKADAAQPLVAMMSAHWPAARERHDIRLRLDLRRTPPLLDIRYRAARPDWNGSGVDEL